MIGYGSTSFLDLVGSNVRRKARQPSGHRINGLAGKVICLGEQGWYTRNSDCDAPEKVISV